MADERYEWLDRDAAEQLLRGEPVGAADEHARAQAARLSAALRGAAAYRHRADDGELPGEAAALAAFRKARADTADPAGASLGTMTVTRDHAPARGLRFGRPLRFGIAAALAGCALGGVAVAAGTGVLPTPFHRDRTPAPASSVTSAATPGPLETKSPDGQRGDGFSLPPAPVGPPPSPPAASGGPTQGSPGDGTAPATPEGPGRDEDTGPTTPGSSPGKETDVRRRIVETCQAYRSGRIDAERRKRLEELADGPDGVKKFCDRVLAAGSSGDGWGDGGQGGDGSSGDGDRGSGGGDSRSGSGKDGSGLVPPVSFRPAPEAVPSRPVDSVRALASAVTAPLL
ncbi:hypothetical protein [Streptomyces sp. t39]|uniref:hypothetical protein n=1 Tax=Streptomyces sp. t39 TaxID=1828156 RepID=UPI0011CD3A05|nr:hypothetical protein [Streptomyces sp. t39]TXS56568.1 hypothetical protein EAO77_10960 [Streptomyces sp. t39]